MGVATPLEGDEEVPRARPSVDPRRSRQIEKEVEEAFGFSQVLETDCTEMELRSRSSDGSCHEDVSPLGDLTMDDAATAAQLNRVHLDTQPHRGSMFEMVRDEQL